MPEVYPAASSGATNPPRKLLSHKDVLTAMISTHVLQRGACGVRSPLYALAD